MEDMTVLALNPMTPGANDDGSGNDTIVPVVSRRWHLDVGAAEDEEDSDQSDPEPVPTTTRRRRATKPSVVLPPPPEFQPLIRNALPAYINAKHERFLVGIPEPVSVFRLFFTDRILKSIVDNTNANAVAKGVAGRAWEPLVLHELVIWMALIIYQSLYEISSASRSVWNLEELGPVHKIARYMSQFRFEQITRYLHVSPLSSPPDSTTPEHFFDKVEPLLSHIRVTSKRLYTPSTNVSVDEMTVRFSAGQVAQTYRMKNKPMPEGYKIFSLCDSGYTYTFFPSSRASQVPAPAIPGFNYTECVVYELVKQLPAGRSYNVFMDSRFSSVRLFQYLRDRNYGACGAARAKGGFPMELRVDKSVKFDWDTRSGVVKDGVLGVLWQDTSGPVTMLTTMHGLVGEEWEVARERRRPRITSTNESKVRAVFGDSYTKELKIPKVIDDYNQHMGAVDRADQLRSYYNLQRPAHENWVPVFFWLLETAIVNSYMITRVKGSQHTQSTFRELLVWGLIESVIHKARRTRHRQDDDDDDNDGHQGSSNVKSRVTKNFRLPALRFSGGDHYAEWRAQRSTCRWCAWRHSQKQIFMDQKAPRQSQVWCKSCDVPLCCSKTRNCFAAYHIEEK